MNLIQEDEKRKKIREVLFMIQGKIEGVCLTNTDPEADWIALVEKNREVLKEYGLMVIDEISRVPNGCILIITLLEHEALGEIQKTQVVLPDSNNLEMNAPEAFLMRRLNYEMLFGIASSNDVLEADQFGPRKQGVPIDSKRFFLPAQIVRARREGLINLLGLSLPEPDPNADPIEYREFSWSDIRLFLQCKRCFYNVKKFGLRSPVFNGEDFALHNALDVLLKREFDKYRERGEKHPIMPEGLRLLKHKKLNKWRTPWVKKDKKKGGIQFYNAWENWFVYGGVDDVWINKDKELVIVEYKSLAQQVVNPDTISYLDMHKKQIEFYAWLFKKNNYKVASIGYLLFCNATPTCVFSDWQIQCEPYLLSHEIDDSWVQPIIYEALECLWKNEIPLPGADCRLCKYCMQLVTKTRKTE